MSSLRQQLGRKDEEMRGMEERYKRYLDKAKSVSKDCRNASTISCQPHCCHACNRYCGDHSCHGNRCCSNICYGDTTSHHEGSVMHGLSCRSFHSSNLSMTSMGKLTHESAHLPPWPEDKSNVSWYQLSHPVSMHGKSLPNPHMSSDVVDSHVAYMSSFTSENAHASTSHEQVPTQTVSTQTRRIHDSHKIGSRSRREALSSNPSEGSGCSRGFFKPDKRSGEQYYLSKHASSTSQCKVSTTSRTMSTSNVEMNIPRLATVRPISETYPTALTLSESGDFQKPTRKHRQSLFAYLLGVYIGEID